MPVNLSAFNAFTADIPCNPFCQPNTVGGFTPNARAVLAGPPRVSISLFIAFSRFMLPIVGIPNLFVNRYSDLRKKNDLNSVSAMKTRQDRLKSAMAEAGLKQVDIAKYIGVSPPTVSELVRGESQSSTHLPKIARLLGVRALWLDTGQGPRYESADELSAEEALLLGYFRKVPPESQRIILAQMRAIRDTLKKG